MKYRAFIQVNDQWVETISCSNFKQLYKSAISAIFYYRKFFTGLVSCDFYRFNNPEAVATMYANINCNSIMVIRKTTNQHNAILIRTK